MVRNKETRTNAGVVLLRPRRLVGGDPPVTPGIGTQVRFALKRDGVPAHPGDGLLQLGVGTWVLRRMEGWKVEDCEAIGVCMC